MKHFIFLIIYILVGIVLEEVFKVKSLYIVAMIYSIIGGAYGVSLSND